MRNKKIAFAISSYSWSVAASTLGRKDEVKNISSRHRRGRVASFSFEKEITVVTNSILSSIILALCCFYVQVSNLFGSLKESSSRLETFETPAAAVDAVFSMATEHAAETMQAHGSVLCRLCAFISAIEQGASCVPYFSYINVARDSLEFGSIGSDRARAAPCSSQSECSALKLSGHSTRSYPN